jgi:hypothetical protein
MIKEGVRLKSGQTLASNFHNYQQFWFEHVLECRSRNGINNPMEGGTGRRKLEKFEELIQEAIALLIKRGKISVPRKKAPLPAKVKDQSSKKIQVTGP